MTNPLFFICRIYYTNVVFIYYYIIFYVLDSTRQLSKTSEKDT